MHLAPYDTQWPARYERERARIETALGPSACRIEHFGSTSVPGLAAKPVIDILVAVADPRDSSAREALERAGYRLAVDEEKHRMFRTPARDVHVHLWNADAPEVDRYLAFRDRLRADAADRALYEHVKRSLIGRNRRDADGYADAKGPVIHAILRRAARGAEGPRIAQFAAEILARIPPAADVLEIGAGEGLLAAQLAAAGCSVTAIDTNLRSIFPIVETSFESYDPGERRFDCVAMQLVLHHVDDIEETLAKVCRLLKPGGVIAVDDYGWERSDDPAFRAERQDLHASEAMLSALRRHFRELEYYDHAYFEDGGGDDRLAFMFLGVPSRAYCERA